MERTAHLLYKTEGQLIFPLQVQFSVFENEEEPLLVVKLYSLKKYMKVVVCQKTNGIQYFKHLRIVMPLQ